jgi:hypothetical protein
MARILSVFLISLIVSAAIAQETEEKQDKNEVGLNAGATTGLGLSYRRWAGNAGVQATVMPIFTDNFDLLSTGLSFLYTVKEHRNLKVFMFVSSHYFYSRNEFHRSQTPDNIYSTSSSTSADLMLEDINCGWCIPPAIIESVEYNRIVEELGFGLGPGFSFGRKVKLNVMLSYGIFPLNKINVYPALEIGGYYAF